MKAISIEPNISDFERKINVENFINQLEMELRNANYVRCNCDPETNEITIYVKK